MVKDGRILKKKKKKRVAVVALYDKNAQSLTESALQWGLTMWIQIKSTPCCWKAPITKRLMSDRLTGRKKNKFTVNTVLGRRTAFSLVGEIFFAGLERTQIFKGNFLCLCAVQEQQVIMLSGLTLNIQRAFTVWLRLPEFDTLTDVFNQYYQEMAQACLSFTQPNSELPTEEVADVSAIIGMKKFQCAPPGWQAFNFYESLFQLQNKLKNCYSCHTNNKKGHLSRLFLGTYLNLSLKHIVFTGRKFGFCWGEFFLLFIIIMTMIININKKKNSKSNICTSLNRSWVCPEFMPSINADTDQIQAT